MATSLWLETITSTSPRWAAFTAANGTQDNYKTIWTEFAQGLDLLPFWSCSDKWELTPHALGGMEPPSLEYSGRNV